MMGKQPGIPIVRSNLPGGVDAAHAAIKANIDRLTGQEKNATRLSPLPATATTAEIIAALNVLIERAGQ